MRGVCLTAWRASHSKRQARRAQGRIKHEHARAPAPTAHTPPSTHARTHVARNARARAAHNERTPRARSIRAQARAHAV
eukprot:2080735-Alexandrium_andersonii.AAC.1